MLVGQLVGHSGQHKVLGAEIALREGFAFPSRSRDVAGSKLSVIRSEIQQAAEHCGDSDTSRDALQLLLTN